MQYFKKIEGDSEHYLCKSSELNEQGYQRLTEFCLRYGKNAENWNLREAKNEAETRMGNSGSNSYELRAHETLSGHVKSIEFYEDDFVWDRLKILDNFESMKEFNEALED